MTGPFHADALIVGGGPAGAATAILLAAAGLRVVLVEQHEFPRQKVCGECLSAGALAILDDLGAGDAVRAVAGPEIRQVGWMGTTHTVIAPFPPCTLGAYEFGRALGRDRLDGILMGRARDLGVQVMQPAKARRIAGGPGQFVCEVESRDGAGGRLAGRQQMTQVLSVPVVIDAHGSWEMPLPGEADERVRKYRTPVRDDDLFAFKATYTRSTLRTGLLPVIAFPGGYGGIVVADDHRTTLACCIRRDALKASRAFLPGQPAGMSVAATLRRSCRGVAEALADAEQESAWLSVGPIRPGVRVARDWNIFRVGNAAGETHPLIGEGINMALHSARLAAAHVSRLARGSIDVSRLQAANRAYAAEWHAAFDSRLRYARWYAHLAMRPTFAKPLNRLLKARPGLMTQAARWAGKARGATPG